MALLLLEKEEEQEEKEEQGECGGTAYFGGNVQGPVWDMEVTDYED